MNQREIDAHWSRAIAASVIDELVVAKVVARRDVERAAAIAAHQILVHLTSEDRPDAHNARYVQPPPAKS